MIAIILRLSVLGAILAATTSARDANALLVMVLYGVAMTFMLPFARPWLLSLGSDDRTFRGVRSGVPGRGTALVVGAFEALLVLAIYATGGLALCWVGGVYAVIAIGTELVWMCSSVRLQDADDGLEVRAAMSSSTKLAWSGVSALRTTEGIRIEGARETVRFTPAEEERFLDALRRRSVNVRTQSDSGRSRGV